MAPTQPTDTLPLPARIFHAAMQRQSSLDAYAAALEIPGDALRALLAAQADQLDPELISRIAAAHGHKADGAALAQPLAAEPFSAWLGRNMEGVSQTSLRARAKLEAPQLRAFLSGKALPDADQAERIARALYIDGAEMARVIVADMARRAERPPAEPAPAGPDAPTPARTRGRRQSQDGADAPPTPGEVAQAEPSPEVAGVPSGRRRRSRAAAPAVEAAPETASLPPTAEATPTQTEASPGEADVAEAAPRRGRRRREHAATPTAETAPAQAEPSPAEAEAPSGRRRRSRAAVPPAETAPETVSPLPAAEAAPTQTEPSSAETEAAEAAPRRGRRRREHAAAAPIEEAVPPDAGSPPSEATADMAPAPDRRSSEQGATAPTVAATVNPGETTLQLSPDEVRLIRIWRRLHPHGRRATMQYIGSLLVEE